MRGAAVEDAHALVGDERHRFARRLVGQTEHGEIDIVEQAAPLGRILATLGRDADHLHARDDQPGRGGR